MATYRVLSGEGLFDVAAKLYRNDTAGGIQDLLTLNPGIDLDATDLYGSALNYTENLNRIKEKFVAIPVIAPALVYATCVNQSIWDLSIQLYGDLSKIGKLLILFPNLDNTIAVGSEIDVVEQNDPIALYFTNHRIKVATDLS